MKNVFIPNEKILTSSCGGKRTTTEFGDYNVDLLKHEIKQTVNDYIKGGESSSRFRWFTIAKIEP